MSEMNVPVLKQSTELVTFQGSLYAISNPFCLNNSICIFANGYEQKKAKRLFVTSECEYPLRNYFATVLLL